MMFNLLEYKVKSA